MSFLLSASTALPLLESRNDVRLFSDGGHYCPASVSKLLEAESGRAVRRDLTKTKSPFLRPKTESSS